MDPIFNRLNRNHPFMRCFFKDHFNITFASTPRYSLGTLLTSTEVNNTADIL